jgi:CDP-diacylglycerol--serine O-phosphatidyltransferase
LRTSPVRYCIPAIFTLANMGCGLAAILLASRPSEFDLAQQVTLCAWLVIAAMIWDGVDGPLARLLLATSRLGNVADSIADWFSFGVAPAALICTIGRDELSGVPSAAALAVAVFYAGATLYRLERHSRRTLRRASSTGEFRGLPSPAAAALAIGLAVTESQSLVAGSDGHSSGLLVMMVVIGVLMVSPIRYPKLANIMRVLPPQLTFLFLVGVCVLIGVLGPWLALVILSSMYAVYPLLRLLLVGTSDDANMATGGGR